MALHVRGRVGLRVAESGGLCQRLLVVGSGGRHGVQDEVGGAVNDAGDALHLVARKRAAQHAHHGDGGGDGGFVVEVDAGGVGGVGKLGAVGGHQGLVGGDHRLSGLECFEDELARVVNAADELDHDVHVVAGNQLARVPGQVQALDLGSILMLLDVRYRDTPHLDRAANSVLQAGRELRQQAQHLGTDGALAQHGNSHGGADALARVVAVVSLGGGGRHDACSSFVVLGGDQRWTALSTIAQMALTVN